MQAAARLRVYAVPASVAAADSDDQSTSTTLLLSSKAVIKPVSPLAKAMVHPAKSPLASLASVSAAVIVPGTSSCAGRQVHAGDGQSSAVAWASSSHAACEVEVEAEWSSRHAASRSSVYCVPASVATTDPECHDTSTSLLLSS